MDVSARQSANQTVVEDAGLAACKLCLGPAPLLGVVDFNKHCPAAPGFVLPLSGIPVYYRQCKTCGGVFTRHCDAWERADFEAHIYNDGYGAVDPEYVDIRPRGNAKFLIDLFSNRIGWIDCLDYGGGNGRLAQLLKAAGFRSAYTTDPFAGSDAPAGRFGLVTCFEVLEHTPRPRETIAEIAGLIAEDGMALFSTLVVPKDFGGIGVNWAYLAPRNGHITFYSRRALSQLWGEHGLRLFSLNDNMHAVIRASPPSFAAHLFKGR